MNFESCGGMNICQTYESNPKGFYKALAVQHQQK